jgi:luciferase family oxidoreductase group 1
LRLSIVDLAPVPPGASTAEAFAASTELAALAERLGYHRYWVAEHHGVGGAVASCCPEALMARIASTTTTIRVGAGTFLLNYSTPFRVAETGLALHAMFPGRIDLGIGRADAAPVVHAALGGGGAPDADAMLGPFAAWMAHEDKVTETVAWLEGRFGDAEARMAHGVPGGPETWLLGSSVESAMLAGRLGLRYGFAAFFNPAVATFALTAYRTCFEPSSRLAQPVAMLAVNACCADTDQQADRLRATVELFYATDGGAQGRHLVDADTAVELLGGVPAPADPYSGLWPRHLSGDPVRLRGQFEQLAAETAADEIIIQDLIADPADRRHSYELIAGAFGLHATSDGLVDAAAG